MNQTDVTATGYRWGLITAAFFIMIVISIYQYSWFLFAYALQKQFNWALSTIGLTFTVFTYAATFIQPFSGFIADNYGPRKVAVTATILVGIGFILASTAKTPVMFYLYYGLGGIGVGILYGISTACAIKWFPDKRGLATGLVVFGFGAGTAIFNWFIQGLLETKGLQATLVYLGIAMLIVLIPLSFLYRYPDQSAAPTKKGSGSDVEDSTDFKPAGMLKTYQWYLIYFSFTFTVSIVLMFGAQMKMVAKEFNLPPGYFSVLLVLFPLGNGLSRVVAGSISDKIGREKTMVFYQLTYNLLPHIDREELLQKYFYPCFVRDKALGALKVIGPFSVIDGDESELSLLFVFKDQAAFKDWGSKAADDPEEQRLTEMEKNEGPYFSNVESKLLASTEYDGIDWE